MRRFLVFLLFVQCLLWAGWTLQPAVAWAQEGPKTEGRSSGPREPTPLEDPDVSGDAFSFPIPDSIDAIDAELLYAKQQIDKLDREKESLERSVESQKSAAEKVNNLKAQLIEWRKQYKGIVDEVMIANCEQDARAVDAPIAKGRRLLKDAQREIRQVQRVLSDGGYWYGGDDVAPKDDSATANPKDACLKAKQAFVDAYAVDRVFEQEEQDLDQGKEAFDRLSERLKRKKKELLGWNKRGRDLRDQKVKLQQEKKADVSDVAMLIAILGIFSLAIMVMVRRFPADIQKEWVLSGQVIQFMTVTVLISAVIALGITEFLKPEILGTLLGAIGGHVLSQGVGRAAQNKMEESQKQLLDMVKAQLKAPAAGSSMEQLSAGQDKNKNGKEVSGNPPKVSGGADV